ncbi:MAG: hypothetical protein HDT14_02115 [Oscillibacter sp.]|nr:hypothetical protein [Oscillibacter sp.]
MMTADAYLRFRNKIDPIIRSCSVSDADRTYLPQGDLAAYRGVTTFTRGNIYYYSTSRARSYQREMLAICRDLPKLDDTFPGTACAITSLALVRRNTNQAMLPAQIEAAEQFFILLTLADAATYRAFKSKSGISYLNAYIAYDFKSIVAP